MQSNVKKMMAKFFADRKNRRRLAAIATSLSVLVVAGVFWQLMQPAVTMTPDPICGQEAHIHDAGCYEQLLTCTLAEDESHTHGEGCYQSILTCGKQEHVHTDACYPEKVTEPTQAPAATEQHEPAAQADAEPASAAASDAENATLPAAEPAENQGNAGEDETQPAADPAENQGNAGENETQPAAEPAENEDNATEPADGEQPAADETDKPDEESKPDTEVPEEQKDEPGEQPAEEEKPAEETPVETEPVEEPAAPLTLSALSASAAQLTVGQTVTWSFAAEQAEKILYVVTDESGAILTQGDAAGDCRQVTWQATHAGRITLTVSAQRGEEATSASGSIEVLAAQELTAYVSAGARYGVAGGSVAFTLGSDGGAAPVTLHAVATQDGTVVAEADVENGTWTVATLSASRATSLEVTLRATDAVGTVTEASCKLPLSTDKAETRDQWVASAAISKSGQWPKDVAAVARTQLGYAESEDNFIIDDNGVTHGWTRYGAWYGASYGEWCAMYASFCLHYAGVPESAFPQEASCSRWISALRGRGLYASAAEATPGVGDLIFLDWEQDGAVDHVGIITAVSGSSVTTIEGNVNHAVAERSYGLTDGRIVGYGLLNAAWAAQEAANQSEDESQPAEEEAAENQPAMGEEPAADDSAETPATDTTLGDSVASDTTLIGNADDDEWSMTGNDVQSASDLPMESADIIADEDEQETITIAFKITNADYTYDQGSGDTHIKVTAPYEEAIGLTFEAWSGQRNTYRVKGTGTLTTLTIPKGTSIAANELSLPKLEIFNIVGNGGVDNNQNSYVSVYSWMKGNTVCTDTTVFTEDTELELQLYTNANNWSLDFVCCETMNSILVTNKSVTFKVGDCISAAYIPTAEQMNALTFSSAHKHENQVFDHWYVVDQQGNQVVFTETTPLTADYVYSLSYGRHIKIYAAWKDDDGTVNVSFMVDDEVYDAKVIEANTALTELPTEPSKEGYVFEGWQYEDGRDYQEGDTFAADTTLRAKFRALCAVKYVIRTWEPSEFTRYFEPDATLDTQKIWLDNNMVETGWTDENGTSYTDDELMELTGEEANGHTYTLIYTLVWTNVRFDVQTGTNYTDYHTIYVSEVREKQTLADIFTANATQFTGELDGYKDYSGTQLVILGWDCNGKTIDEETPITAEIASSSDLSFKAVYGVPLTTSTVTFVYQDYADEPNSDGSYPTKTYATVEIALNQPLSSAMDVLPEAPAFDGYAFEGWYCKIGDTTTSQATLDTVISADTTYTAVYRKIAQCTVRLHDMDPDGNEILPEQVASIDVTVPYGTTLGEYLDVMLADGTAAADCVWNTLDANGQKVAYLLSTPVICDLDLYTYSYRLVLQLDSASGANTGMLRWLIPSAEAATVTVDGNTLTIDFREGEALKASDFVIDGVDYTLYKWTDAANKEYSLMDLVKDPPQDILVLTQGSQIYKCHSMAVTFYAFVDGNRIVCATKTIDVPLIASSYYISAAQLEAIYGQYGFNASSVTNNTYYFPHATSADGNLWSDRAAIDGYSPVTTTAAAEVWVYYLPNGVKQSENDKDGYAFKEVKDTNSFYTVRVIDSYGIVSDQVPAKQYVLAGQDVTVTVNNEETDEYTYQWVCRDSKGNVVPGVLSGNTNTYSFENIGQSYTLTSQRTIKAVGEGQVAIIYNLNTPTVNYPPDDDDSWPQVGGNRTQYVVILDASGTYDLLNPSPTMYFTPSPEYTDAPAGRYKDQVAFAGWMNSNQQIVSNINLEGYAGQTITLDGQWEYTPTGRGHKDGPVVSFFVALNALPEGTTSWKGSTTTSNFTPTVYSADCGVNGSYFTGDQILLGGTDGSDLNATSNDVVNHLTNGFVLSSYSFQCTFPTDEQVLKTIRSMVNNHQTTISINGKNISAADLTTENFTIKWYVFKYDSTDGWHVDGILVAKKGELVVTKTFAGNKEAINKIKENYSITVEGGTVNNGGTCTVENANKVDEAADTYTWIIPVDQYYTYTVTENNYTMTEELYTSDAKVRVEHSRTQSENTEGWVSYSDSEGISVTGRGNYEHDENKLHVSFLNTYTAPGTLVLRKVDAVTGNAMPGVEFDVKKYGEPLVLVYQGNGSYTADVSGGAETTSTIETDYSGQAYLYIGGGRYTFDEKVPTGYDDPGSITAELQGTENNDYEVVAITSVNAQYGDKFVAKDGDKLELIIKNYARLVDLSVNKEWTDHEDLEVEVQLIRNGTPLGTSYRITLNGAANWEHTWNNLPLYADGGLANYTLREERIGSYAHSDEYSDGYRYFDVSYGAPRYLDESGNVTQDMSAVRKIALTVTNKRSTGNISINKVDAKGATLAGATFSLYSCSSNDTVPTVNVVDGKNVLKRNEVLLTALSTVTSDASGKVDFGVQNAGDYYMIEESAPAGYLGDSRLYKLSFVENNITLQYYENGQWLEYAGTSVVNTKSTANIKIIKIDGNNQQQLNGAAFQLKKLVGTTYENVDGGSVELENASYEFMNLEAGSYQLVETKAPDGYYKLTQPINFTVNVDGTVECNIPDNVGYFNPSTNTITVTNTAGSQLPQTGGSGTLVYMFGGLLMMAASLICGLSRRRKGERGEGR